MVLQKAFVALPVYKNSIFKVFFCLISAIEKTEIDKEKKSITQFIDQFDFMFFYGGSFVLLYKRLMFVTNLFACIMILYDKINGFCNKKIQKDKLRIESYKIFWVFNS